MRKSDPLAICAGCGALEGHTHAEDCTAVYRQGAQMPSPQKPEHQALDKIAAIYRHVEEMNRLVNELAGLGVECRMGGRPSPQDPLGSQAVVEFRMRTTMEPLPRVL